jgi:hypothetical protein
VIERMRIVVLGYVVRGPLGGMTWHYLHYLLGLSALGHDVYFAEDSDDAPFCYDPSRDATDANPAYGLAYADETFRRFGLESRWAYYDAPRREWKGGARHIIEICRTADLLLNVSGVNRMRDWFRGIPRRCLVDTDPAFMQIRHRVSPEARAYALEHTCHLSFGANIGRPGCLVPNDGFSWEPTRQPIALDYWTSDRWRPFRAMPWRRPRFTSVMLWYSYPPLDYEGVQYGTKWHSFQAYASLPTVVPAAQLELAAASPRWAWAPPDVQVHELRRQGWRLRDPLGITRDCFAYRRYIVGSDAEFGLAKEGYVVSRSGWFSERSAAYLAAGKPVVAQDTGFSAWLPSGLGLLAFRDPDEAREAIESVAARYDVHRRAARDIAVEYFDGRRVLTSLLDRAMASSNTARG